PTALTQTLFLNAVRSLQPSCIDQNTFPNSIFGHSSHSQKFKRSTTKKAPFLALSFNIPNTDLTN
ncbi:hypothetical protein V7111_10750, partial [Neobacillus niacini]|uniref:hypothetical protein n=1 Tax=Neobacillus niacini TaxID=86668 RepID=UPI002FFE9178